MRFRLRVTCALAWLAPLAALAAGPTGAIFTTTPDGTVVNENVRYDFKIEVYLDGGPGPNAPQTAAGLDDALYVFQVTDPPGKLLLSQDPAKCRVVEVQGGVIVREVQATELGLADSYAAGNKTYACRILDGAPEEGVAGPSGRHDWNYDADHGPPAIVVQLMPFGTTPNPGGVYKAWMTRLADYLAKGGDLEAVPVAVKGRDAQPCKDFCAAADPGFQHPDVKTDNFKVKLPGKLLIPPEIAVKKFHDKNANGVFDVGDEWVTGWQVDFTDPSGLASSLWTPWTILAEPPGAWSFTEATPQGTLQTASFVDGAQTIPFPANPVTVTVAGTSGEKHEVVFGDVGLGALKACKLYDRNGNGAADEGEPFIPGWRFSLSGVLANGSSYGPAIQLTGGDGCTTFQDLLPGTYTVSETLPAGWFTVGDVFSPPIDVVSTLSGSVIAGRAYEFGFLNYCVREADFDTKGYWHNKNGLSELTEADRDQVNGLAPYGAPSSYFEAGDEPFDGLFQDGVTPVAPAFNNDDGSLVWGPATWQAEISQFLVDSNAGGGGGDQEQLAQQLLAFIFNTRHRLDDPSAAIWTGAGWMSAAAIIDQAILAWGTSTADDDKLWEPILDAFNNSDALPYIPAAPCTPVF